MGGESVMTPEDFFQSGVVQSMVSTVSERTGIPKSVLLAQMADETGYGTSYAWLSSRNPAGIKAAPGEYSADPPYAYYPSYAAAAAGWANFYLDNSYYSTVISKARAGDSPAVVATALGESPWASGHYDLNGQPGGSLISIINTYQLTRYDTAQNSGNPAVKAYGPTESPERALLWLSLAALGMLLFAASVYVEEKDKTSR
jgi:flagellum-specific peptidoglycan hydrolase FlgJ